MMTEEQLKLAASQQLVIRYAPKDTLYRVIGLAHIRQDDDSSLLGLSYVGEDRVTYTRPLSMFDGFEAIEQPESFLDNVIDQSQWPIELCLGQTKIKQLSGEWVLGLANWRADKNIGVYAPHQLKQFAIIT